MNLRAFFKTLFFALFSASAVFAAPPSDEDAKRLLAGDWVMQKQPGLAGGTMTFKPDGKFLSQPTIQFRKETITISLEGTWRVEKGTLVEEVTKSSHPALIPLGHSSRDTILSVTDKEFRTRTDNGKEEVFSRAEKGATPAPPK